MSFGDTVKAFFRNPFVQQFGLLTVLVVLGFGLSQTMAGGGEIMNAMGTATTAVLAITLIVLPISYIMNYLIYHSRAMRAGSGIIGWLMGPLVWVYIVFRSVGAVLGTTEKIPYFGMFPLFETVAAPPSSEEGSWFMNMLQTVFISPVTKLFEIHIGGDVDRMAALLAPYIAPTGSKPVNEGLNAIASEIATYAKIDSEATLTANPEKKDKAVGDLASVREAMRSAVGNGKGGNFEELKVRREELLKWIAQ
jgi:hypothetical protein